MKKLSLLILLFFVFVTGFSQNQPVQNPNQNSTPDKNNKKRQIIYIHLADTNSVASSALSMYNFVLKRENSHQRKVLQGMIKEIVKDKENFEVFGRPFILEGKNASRQQLYTHLDAIPDSDEVEYVLVLSIGTHGIEDEEGSPYPSIKLYNPITGGSQFYKVSDLVDNLKNKYSKKFNLIFSVISACNGSGIIPQEQVIADNSSDSTSTQGLSIATDPNATVASSIKESNRKLFLQDGFVMLLSSEKGLYTYGNKGEFLHISELKTELRNAFIMDTLGNTTFKDILENVKQKTELSANSLNVKQIPYYEIDVRERNSNSGVSAPNAPIETVSADSDNSDEADADKELSNRAYKYLVNSSTLDVVSYLNLLQDVQDASLGRQLAETKWHSIIVNFFNGNGAAKYQTSNLGRKTISTQNVDSYLKNLYNYLTRRAGKLYVDIDIHLEEWNLANHGTKVISEQNFKPIAGKKNQWEGTIQIKQHFIGTRNKRNIDPPYTDNTIKTFTVRVVYNDDQDIFSSYFTRVDAQVPSLPDGCTPAE